MPKAAKRASKRYKKFSWADAMRKVWFVVMSYELKIQINS
jgi:hypothetical protein